MQSPVSSQCQSGTQCLLQNTRGGGEGGGGGGVGEEGGEEKEEEEEKREGRRRRRRGMSNSRSWELCTELDVIISCVKLTWQACGPQLTTMTSDACFFSFNRTAWEARFVKYYHIITCP